jgi:hypothetical protein
MFCTKYEIGQKVFYFEHPFKIESDEIVKIVIQKLQQDNGEYKIVTYYFFKDWNAKDVCFCENELFGSKQECKDFYIEQIKKL